MLQQINSDKNNHFIINPKFKGFIKIYKNKTVTDVWRKKGSDNTLFNAKHKRKAGNKVASRNNVVQG